MNLILNFFYQLNNLYKIKIDQGHLNQKEFVKYFKILLIFIKKIRN